MEQKQENFKPLNLSPPAIKPNEKTEYKEFLGADSFPELLVPDNKIHKINSHLVKEFKTENKFKITKKNNEEIDGIMTKISYEKEKNHKFVKVFFFLSS